MYKNSKNTRIWARDTPIVHKLKGLSKGALRLQAQAEAASLAKRDAEIVAKADLLRKEDLAKEAGAAEFYRLNLAKQRVAGQDSQKASLKAEVQAQLAKQQAKERTKLEKQAAIREREAEEKYWQDDKIRQLGYFVEGQNTIYCPECRQFQNLTTKPNGDAICTKCAHEWWPYRTPRLQK